MKTNLRCPTGSLLALPPGDKARSAVAMARSSEPGGSRRDGGRVRLVDYPRSAGRPTITVLRHAGLPAGPVPGTHAHDFLVLLYVEQGGGVLRVDGRDRTLHARDAFVVAPGAVVTPHGGHGGVGARAWVVFFAADAVDPAAPPVSWRPHPLLARFGGTRGGGGRRLPVPAEARAAWLAHLGELDAELRGRADEYAEAARAHLTLLLVRLARL